MKILLSSANLGNIDPLGLRHEPQRVPVGTSIDLRYHTDQTMPPRSNALHPRLQAKIPKMLSHEMDPGYDYYLWLDSSIYLADEGAVQWMLDELGTHEIVFFRHPHRDSVAAELDFCVAQMDGSNPYLRSRYLNEPMQQQVASYLADRSYVDDRLFACGVFCYSSALLTKHPEFLRGWYGECARWSVQDQLSLPWLLQKQDVRYTTTAADIFENPYFRMVDHTR
ncbi:glycosyltransferase domain-containing protein [Piscinibacter sakaiensis]|uniref:glycosyltransferase domain-containing protein n=1 Tax=Piscinibacter sakaiensis TaxID=1547922 RepID=UPI003AACADCC